MKLLIPSKQIKQLFEKVFKRLFEFKFTFYWRINYVKKVTVMKTDKIVFERNCD